MNERIRELESQCWEERKYGPAWFDSKKFAELIVRECIGIVEPSSYRRAYPENYRGGIDCLETLEERAAKIKEHFGLKND